MDMVPYGEPMGPRSWAAYEADHDSTGRESIAFRYARQ